MNLTIFLSLLVCLIGLVVYAVAKNPKTSEIAKISFGCGLLAFLLSFPVHVLHIGTGG